MSADAHVMTNAFLAALSLFGLVALASMGVAGLISAVNWTLQMTRSRKEDR